MTTHTHILDLVIAQDEFDKPMTSGARKRPG